MRILLSLVGAGVFFSALPLRADVLEMQNGDRYSGRVLALATNSVEFSSEVLGKISVPRSQVATMTFGTNAAAPKATGNPARPANLPVPAGSIVVSNANANLSAALRQLGGNTNFIAQIRQQMLGGNAEAGGKYDDLVNGLVNGQIDLKELRRQAQASADQLRTLKRELGPDADESLDGYLKILNDFVNETADPANPAAK